jgi:hypothetical protein
MAISFFSPLLLVRCSTSCPVKVLSWIWLRTSAVFCVSANCALLLRSVISSCARVFSSEERICARWIDEFNRRPTAAITTLETKPETICALSQASFTFGSDVADVSTEGDAPSSSAPEVPTPASHQGIQSIIDDRGLYRCGGWNRAYHPLFPIGMNIDYTGSAGGRTSSDRSRSGSSNARRMGSEKRRRDGSPNWERTRQRSTPSLVGAIHAWPRITCGKPT